MLFSDETRRLISEISFGKVAAANVASLNEVGAQVNINIAPLLRDVNARLLSAPAPEEVDAALRDGIDDVDAIFVYGLPMQVDMAKRTPGRGWMAELLRVFEAHQWRLVDAMADGAGQSVLAAFSSKDGLLNSRSRFYHMGRLVDLMFASATDIMRTKSVLTASFYERYMLDHISANYKGGAIIDVGANVGNHTVAFGLIAQKCGAQVYAVEPSPAAVDLLKRNVAVNKLTAETVIIPVAAGEATRRIVMRPGGSSNHLGAMKVVGRVGEADGIEAAMMPLDEMIDPHIPVALMKIDVEGYELPAIAGAARIIASWKPDLYVEAGTDAALIELELVVGPMGYIRRGRFNDTPTYWYVHEND